MTQTQAAASDLTESEETPTLGSRIDPNYTIADMVGEIAEAVRIVAGQPAAPGRPRLTTGEAIKIVELSLEHTRAMHQLELAYNTVYYPPATGEDLSPHEAEVEAELDAIAQATFQVLDGGTEDDPAIAHEPTVAN
jgi:hypothetical protein